MTVNNSLRLVATVSLFFTANCAIACSCEPRQLFKVNPSQNIERAEAIMVGEIMSVTPENVTVSPIEVFKGKISKSLIFENADRGIGCNYFGIYNARVGDRHLFFYNYSSRISLCSYSAPIEKSADKLETLRKQFNKNTKYSAPKLAH